MDEYKLYHHNEAKTNLYNSRMICKKMFLVGLKSEDVVGNTEDYWGWIREKFNFITTWTAGWILLGDFVTNIHSVALLFGMSAFDKINAKYEQQSVYLQITRRACGGGNSCRDLLNRARQKWHCLLWESRKGHSMLSDMCSLLLLTLCFTDRAGNGSLISLTLSGFPYLSRVDKQRISHSTNDPRSRRWWRTAGVSVKPHHLLFLQQLRGSDRGHEKLSWSCLAVPLYDSAHAASISCLFD